MFADATPASSAEAHNFTVAHAPQLPSAAYYSTQHTANAPNINVPTYQTSTYSKN